MVFTEYESLRFGTGKVWEASSRNRVSILRKTVGDVALLPKIKVYTS